LLKDLKHIAHTVHSGADILVEDIEELGHSLKRRGADIKSLVNLTKKVYKRGNAKKK
jgi:hypothetical protein